MSIHFKSDKQDWSTPIEFMEFLRMEFNWEPDLDPACSPHNIKATFGYMLEAGQDGLNSDWFGNVWLNPPFGNALPHWLNKCVEEIYLDRVESIYCLIPARVETKWFHEIVMPHAETVYLIKGRINFFEEGVSLAKNAPFPSMLIVFKNKFENHYDGVARIHTLDVPLEYRLPRVETKGGESNE